MEMKKQLHCGLFGDRFTTLNRILEIKMIAFTKCQTIPTAYKVEIEDS